MATTGNGGEGRGVPGQEVHRAWAGRAIDAFRDDLRLHGNASVAREHAVFTVTRGVQGAMTVKDSHALAERALASYSSHSRTMPHEKAREAAVTDAVRQPSLDVQGFASRTIDRFRQLSTSEGSRDAQQRVPHEMAKDAGAWTAASYTRLGRMAEASIKEYRNRLENFPEFARKTDVIQERERNAAARSIAERYDGQGVDRGRGRSRDGQSR